MPTPVGHALAGFAIAGLAASQNPVSIRQLVFLTGCAVAPDLDLVLKLVDGANHHRGASHSVGAVVLVGVVVALLRRLKVDVPAAQWASAAWASHLLLDFFGVDTSPPFGEMALWPLSQAFYISPVSVFYDVPRSFTTAAMMHNLTAVLIELLIMAPLAILCWRIPRRGTLKP